LNWSWVHNGARAVLLLAAAGMAAPLRADTVNGPLGLVRVEGGGYHEARDAARELEDLLHRLDSLYGAARPTPVKPLIHLALPERKDGRSSRVRLDLAAGLPGRVTVRGDWREAADDVAARLVRLDFMLRLGGPGRAVPRVDWLTTGVAESLQAAQRARNREWTQILAETGPLPTLAEIASWRRIPDGPMLEKGVCGHAVQWMLAERGGTGLLFRIQERLRRDGDLTAAALLAELDQPGATAPEAAWRAAASDPDVIVGGRREAGPLLIGRFRAALQTPAAEVGLDRVAGPFVLSPAQLLAVRTAPGVRPAARSRARALRTFAVGTPPELRDQALAYAAFFDRLAGRRVPAFWLRRRLARMERVRRNWEDLTLARLAWMEGLDAEAAARDADGAGLFGRSAVARYLDDAEHRLQSEATEPGAATAAEE